MKKIFIILFAFCIVHQSGFSQEISFPIRYSLSLCTPDTLRYPLNYTERTSEDFLDELKKRKTKTIAHTKLDSGLTMKMYANFVQHIAAHKNVKSYLNPTYNIGTDFLAGWKIDELENKELYQPFGNYYLSLEATEFEWENGEASGNGWTKITPSGNFLFACDTIQIQYPFPPYDYHDSVFCQYKGPDYTDGLSFTEIWNFNQVLGNFSKKVEFIDLKLNSYVESVKFPLFSFKAQSTASANKFKENMKYDVFFDLWNSCQTGGEDACDQVQVEFSKSASTYNYISTENRTELILDIFNAVEAGTLIPLETKSFEKGKEKVLTIDKMYESMTHKEKVSVMESFPPYNEKDTVVTSVEPFENIIGIRFIEDWSFEPEQLNFYKKVKTFALLFISYDNTGELSGYRPLFYLKPKN
jgi:hypothetical protein